VKRRPPPRALEIEARAKLNLGIAVGPERADGFHEIATIYQSITLADTLRATRTRRGFRLRVRYEDVSLNRRAGRTLRSHVPAGEGNLVLRAARRAAERAGIAGGASFLLTKRIPSRAGLGGGSADAAAAIAAIAALYPARLPLAARRALCAEIGSDVPFALQGGTAIGLGRGERLRRVSLRDSFRVLLAVPRWRVVTAWAYKQISRTKFGLTAWPTKLRSAQSLGRKRISLSRALRLGNTFEGVLGSRREEFRSLRERLRAAGAADVRMTGSGSAVFGVLARSVPAVDVVGRFAGSESLFLARSAREGLRFRKLS
jgi:4-diphosphocytidyl-2-C-methyl-D-erythritol kinase